MNTSHLLRVMKEADLSPEQMGVKLGVSGMTLRRWKVDPPGGVLPKIYEEALIRVISELVTEGKLSTTHPIVEAVISERPSTPFVGVRTSLGIAPETLKGGVSNERQLIESLYQLGILKAHKSEVDNNKKRIHSFKKMGRPWANRVTSMWRAITSSELRSVDKWVAYGALFYLICPFDVIPDWIPVFGYMDDFMVLGFAVTYYLKRFPHLFRS